MHIKRWLAENRVGDIFDDEWCALHDTWYFHKSNNILYYLDDEFGIVILINDKNLWIRIDNDCYTFDEYGKMYCDCVTPDG